jgi:2-polyprenyl-3-methyl-5-hydroxy-6-metoxy-1,4-benzoquinol methylase
MGAKDPVNDAPAIGDDCPEHLPHNIDFRKATAEDFADPVPFGLVVGQYVLLHHPDPAAFIRIRGAAARLRSHGIIAFREIDMRKAFETLPPVPRLDDE